MTPGTSAPRSARRQTAGGLVGLLRLRALLPVLALDGDGLVPAPSIREAFHLLRPQALKTMARSPPAAAIPSCAPVPAPSAAGPGSRPRFPAPWPSTSPRTNALIDGTLTVRARRADLSRRAGLPILLLTTTRDHIVPAASCEALTHVDGLDVDVLHCAAGHVAMLAGHEAHRVRCPGLDAFLVPHRAPSATQVALEG